MQMEMLVAVVLVDVKDSQSDKYRRRNHFRKALDVAGKANADHPDHDADHSGAQRV